MLILNTSAENQTSISMAPNSGFSLQFEFQGAPELYVEARLDDDAPWRAIHHVTEMKPNIHHYPWYAEVRVRVGMNQSGESIKAWYK